MSRASSPTRKCAAALFTVTCFGMPMTGHAAVILQEKPSDLFSLADGSVRNGKIVGDKLLIVGPGGRLEAAPDGFYKKGGASFKVEKGVIVSGGGGGRPADPGAATGFKEVEPGKVPKGK